MDTEAIKASEQTDSISRAEAVRLVLDEKFGRDILAQRLRALPSLQSVPTEQMRAYHCPCGAACTAVEYIDHLLKGHDRGEQSAGEQMRERQGIKYPHFCCDGHENIGHANSGDDERCPLCRMRDELDAASEQMQRLLAAGIRWRDARTRYHSDQSVNVSEYGLAGDELATVITALQSLTPTAGESASLQRKLYEECVTAQWDAGKQNTFAEEIAHLHEELSEAFRAWRRYKDTEVREVDGKLEGVPIEFADVLIGLFYNAELHGFDLLEAVERKHQFNLKRNYMAEGRQLHDDHERDLQFVRDKLPVAQTVAPETNGIKIDSEHNWFGHCNGTPTTHIAGPNEVPEPIRESISPALAEPEPPTRCFPNMATPKEGTDLTDDAPTCTRCDRLISYQTFGPPINDASWYHLHNGLVWCVFPEPAQSSPEPFTAQVLQLVAKYDIHDSIFWNSSLKFFVNVNDVFAWGTADLQEVTAENIDALEQAIIDCEKLSDVGEVYGGWLFAARIRKVRPQGASYPEERELWPLFDACGPEREVGFGNPCRPGEYKSGSVPVPTDARGNNGKVMAEFQDKSHLFKSMHQTDSCWHCDRRMLDPIHVTDAGLTRDGK